MSCTRVRLVHGWIGVFSTSSPHLHIQRTLGIRWPDSVCGTDTEGRLRIFTSNTGFARHLHQTPPTFHRTFAAFGTGTYSLIKTPPRRDAALDIHTSHRKWPPLEQNQKVEASFESPFCAYQFLLCLDEVSDTLDKLYQHQNLPHHRHE